MSQKTMENLAAAFAGESQANRKYLAFAAQAEKEGHAQVAKLFRAVAEAETLHAHSHLRIMGGVKTTAENLQEAFDGEHYEFTTMYPEFLKVAEAEGNKEAVRTFTFANEAEKVHGGLYRKYLENLGRNEAVDLHLCSVCGHVAEGSAPEACPLCGAKKQAYKLIA